MVKKNLGLIISIFIGLIISLFYSLDFLKPLETKLGYDFTFLIKPHKLPNPAIKIIGIDQKTLDYLGYYPLRRSDYAHLLKFLGNYPKITAFDIIFSENSDLKEDIKFADAIKKAGNVILAMGLTSSATLEKDGDKPSKYKEEQFVDFKALDEFVKNAKALSVVNYFTDEDGILRKSKMSYKYTDTDNSKKESNTFSYEVSKDYLDLKNTYISLPDEIYCNYQKLEGFKDNTYSLYDVVYEKPEKRINPNVFKNSIVLVGALAEGLQDRVSTPIGPMNGVEYHAQLISNILNNDYIRPMPKAINVMFILLASVIAYIVWKSVGTINQILLIIFSVVSLYGIHVLLFSYNIWISIVSIIIATIATFVTLILFSQFKIARALKSELDNLIRNYESRKLQYKIYNPTGKLELNLKPSNDGSAEKIKKLAEIGNNLTIQRSFLETLLNNIEISIIVTNSVGNISLINPAAKDFLTEIKKNKNKLSEFEQNFKNINIIGNNFVDIMSSIPEVQSNLLGVYDGNTKLPVEYTAERGERIYKLKLLQLFEDGKVLNDSDIVCLIEDITDWHQSVNRDGLTTLWNQKYFKEHLYREIEKAKRYKNNLSLIMMDVDLFKKFNDTYGHQTGDIVLKSIASVLHDKSRTTDIAARYGGEEFSVILPMTDEAGAIIFAERVRRAIEKLEILDINGNPVGKVTASLGVSYYDNYDLTLNEFIERADESLYVCKDRGRNCVTKYSDIEHYKKQISLQNKKNQ